MTNSLMDDLFRYFSPIIILSVCLSSSKQLYLSDTCFLSLTAVTIVQSVRLHFSVPSLCQVFASKDSRVKRPWHLALSTKPVCQKSAFFSNFFIFPLSCIVLPQCACFCVVIGDSILHCCIMSLVSLVYYVMMLKRHVLATQLN